MKFRNVGQVLLALVVFVALGFGVTSCTNSYTVGYLYVTGAQSGQNNGNNGNTISGYNINNQTGQLKKIRNSPFGSNGANPVRTLVLSGGRFLYVLNQGTFSYASDGTSSGTASNISLFQIGGNGVLTFQASYASQGSNSISMLTDSSGLHLYVLDSYGTLNGAAIPSTSAPTASTPCENPADGRFYPTGDVSAYSIDANTGRLTLITNQQVPSPDGKGQLTYFPLGCFPTEFLLNTGYLFTIDQGGTSNQFHTADLQTVFSYSQSTSSGQLSLTQNAPLQTGAAHLTSINGNSSRVYLLDAGPVNCVSNTTGATSLTQILPYTVGSGGILQSLVGGNVCNDPTAVNPTVLVVDSKNKFLYVANSGNTANTQSLSEITAFTIDATTGTLAFIAGQPFKNIAAGARCMLEDPSNQFIYTAGFNDGTVVGTIIDANSGVLNPLRNGATSFPATGSPTWCTVSGRTQ